MFLLLITGIGALVLIYAGAYLKGHVLQGRFFGFLLLFMLAMLGLVAADNLLLLVVFWELTSISSYLLIGFDHENAKSRAAALQALLVTGGGGLALLAGVILIGRAAGTYSITSLLANPEPLLADPHCLPAMLLVLTGALTKSAQTPFHFWLPNAMAAPTPVSAYLHSATMVKAGVFLMGRMNPVFNGLELWHDLLTGFGAATMITGAAMALPQTDLKRLLAYSTVSALGILTLLIGIGTPDAIAAACLFLIVHSLYKGGLFLVAGAVDHETGTRDVRALTGLSKVMPLTAAAAGCAACTMSGLPPTLGFISKELLYEANLHAPATAGLITAAGVGANMMLVAVAIIAGVRPFYGGPQGAAAKGHEPPASLWLGPVLLAALAILTGVLPQLVDRTILAGAATAVSGAEAPVPLKLWHGFNLVLALSVITLLGGAGLFALRRQVSAFACRLAPAARYGPDQIYGRLLAGMLTAAAFQTRLLQHGRLRGYVFTVLATATILAAYALWRFGPVPIWVGFDDVRLHEVVLAAILLAAAGAAVRARSRLAAVAALSVVGYGVALVYALYGAPDLALTQVLVETLTLVLFVLVLVHLPRIGQLSSDRRRFSDALFAAGAGGVISLLVFKALHVETAPSISSYFAENALQAQGRNVVNVILVDFRALDTLGEITVISVAALGVTALLKLRLSNKKEGKS